MRRKGSKIRWLALLSRVQGSQPTGCQETWQMGGGGEGGLAPPPPGEAGLQALTPRQGAWLYTLFHNQ